MEEKKKGFFSRLVAGLTKTRENIVSGMDSIFSGFSAIDEDFYEELEETLIMGDMGIQTTMSVLEELKGREGAAHQGSVPMPPGAHRQHPEKNGPGRKRV